MRRYCNLELQLLPPSSDNNLLLSSDYKSSYDDQIPKMDLSNNGSPKEEQKELTIFYNGKMVSCDVTELQARAIILLAKRENEEISKSSASCYMPSINSSPLQQPQQQLYAPTTLSMKKSLQQFLHKRKIRMQSASPYYHH